MKQVDFAHGRTLSNILATAVPMLAAQILNLLYNIVDRIYIARIPGVGTAALGAVGLCFPVILLITAFTNLYGSGGAPLFAIARGQGDEEEAKRIQDTSFFLLLLTGASLTVLGELIGRPTLRAFGASENALVYALPYLRIYLLGTLFSMIATGMNPFINAQGFSTIGMLTVTIGAVANFLLDPLFIFVLHMGVQGAAVATVLSQALSAAFSLSFLLGKRSSYPVKLLRWKQLSLARVRRITGLGFAGFIMQFTNTLVSISCNRVLGHFGGDLYISIMTIVSSARQMIETPIHSLAEGSSPVISYNFGARRPQKVREATAIMFLIATGYSLLVWGFIRLFPEKVISIFSSDKTILEDTIPAFHLYFSAFLFMVFQYTGQNVFKSLGLKYQAIFFSLFRKVAIVVPLTYLLPYTFHMGTNGVFLAEPISNAVGGLACFITMLIQVLPMLKKMEKDEEKGSEG